MVICGYTPVLRYLSVNLEALSSNAGLEVQWFPVFVKRYNVMKELMV